MRFHKVGRIRVTALVGNQERTWNTDEIIIEDNGFQFETEDKTEVMLRNLPVIIEKMESHEK